MVLTLGSMCKKLFVSRKAESAGKLCNVTSYRSRYSLASLSWHSRPVRSMFGGAEV